LLADTIEDAEDWFVDAKERLLDVSNWRKYSSLNPEFRLTDSHGRAVSRKAHRGDHIRIDLPDGKLAGVPGFEWAKIEAIEYDDYPDLVMETLALRIRNCEIPLPHSQDEYLWNAAVTGTFVIERRMRKITATYHGRNQYGGDDLMTGEMDHTEWLGLAANEWEKLLKGLVRIF